MTSSCHSKVVVSFIRASAPGSIEGFSSCCNMCHPELSSHFSNKGPIFISQVASQWLFTSIAVSFLDFSLCRDAALLYSNYSSIEDGSNHDNVRTDDGAWIFLWIIRGDHSILEISKPSEREDDGINFENPCCPDPRPRALTRDDYTACMLSRCSIFRSTAPFGYCDSAEK